MSTDTQNANFDRSLAKRLVTLQNDVRRQAAARPEDVRRRTILDSLGTLLDQPIRAANYLGTLGRTEER